MRRIVVIDDEALETVCERIRYAVKFGPHQFDRADAFDIIKRWVDHLPEPTESELRGHATRLALALTGFLAQCALEQKRGFIDFSFLMDEIFDAEYELKEFGVDPPDWSNPLGTR